MSTSPNQKKPRSKKLAPVRKDHVDPVTKTIVPLDEVLRATEIEVLKFCKADAELRNALQGCRIKELEIAEIRSRLQQEISRLELEKFQLQRLAETLSSTNKAVCQEIADKFGLDPKQMSIDPDTRIIRDLRSK